MASQLGVEIPLYLSISISREIAMAEDQETVFVDCEAGRRMGCATYCCRLLVRLKPHEMQPSDGHTAAKGFVDKDEHGLCVHLNHETWGCNIWAQRPQTCREYDCNSDFLLQVVLREGFTNIADIARKYPQGDLPENSDAE